MHLIFIVIAMLACFNNVKADEIFGSNKILNGLWSYDQLSAIKSELKVQYHTQDLTTPMFKYHKISMNNDFYGIIRSVDINTPKKFIALTFDFCEFSTNITGYDGYVIDFLRKNNIPATLFISGKWMLTHPLRAMQLISDPLFEIGNHTWSHGNLAIMNLSEVEKQIIYTQQQYHILRKQIIGRVKATLPDLINEVNLIPEYPKLFRFPYGRSRPEALSVIKKLGLTTIQWDAIGLEYKLATFSEVDRFAKNLHNGSIILLHANAVPKYTLNFLQKLIPILKNQNYNFVSVSNLLDKGEIHIEFDGYFEKPNDNLFFDAKYAEFGTAHKNFVN